MSIYHPYALVVGLLCAACVVVGSSMRNRRLVIAALVFGAASSSPITTFTRGASGAIFPADVTAVGILFVMITGLGRPIMSPVKPKWIRRFGAYIVAALTSILIVAPFATSNLDVSGQSARVNLPIPIPLGLAMAGFRVMRMLLYWAYFSFAARVQMDERTWRFTLHVLLLALCLLAVCQIATFVGVADFGLYMPGAEYQSMRMVGHAKPAIGRLYVVGVFICLALLYRSLKSPLYLSALALLGTALYCAGSRAALVGVAVGFLIFAMKARAGGKIMAAFLVIAILGAVAQLATLDSDRAEQFARMFENPSEEGRWTIWTWVLQYLGSHPWIMITGVGFSNFSYALMAKGAVAEHAHNDGLTCLTEMGIFGFGFFLAYLVSLTRGMIRHTALTKGGRPRWEAVCMLSLLAGFLATSLFEPSMYYAAGASSMQRILAVLLGTYTALRVQEGLQPQVFAITPVDPNSVVPGVPLPGR